MDMESSYRNEGSFILIIVCHLNVLSRMKWQIDEPPESQDFEGNVL